MTESTNHLHVKRGRARKPSAMSMHQIKIRKFKLLSSKLLAEAENTRLSLHVQAFARVAHNQIEEAIKALEEGGTEHELKKPESPSH